MRRLILTALGVVVLLSIWLAAVEGFSARDAGPAVTPPAQAYLPRRRC